MRGILKPREAPPRLASFLHAEDGIVSVVTAIAVFALLGIAALSFDLGRAWNLDTQLQNAADAAALACASQLDRTDGARARGTTAATNGALAQNSQNFATDGAGTAVTITAGNVTFYSSYANGSGTAATSDADASFCKVAVSPRTVNFSFAAAVAGPASASPGPAAVAAMNTARCAVPPMMICNPQDPDPFDPAAYQGRGVTLKAQQGNQLAPGNFGLLALNDQNLSTDDIRDAWARVHPLAQCFGEQITTKPGQATAVAQGVNVRFDIFANGLPNALQSDPEYTPAMNTVKGLIRTGANPSCAMINNGWKDPSVKYNGNPTPPPTAMGLPRDRCAYNGGSCDVYAGGTAIEAVANPNNPCLDNTGRWDCLTYRDVSHPSVATPETTWDLNGDDYVSRYEVYQWELLNNTLSVAEAEDSPVCHSAPNSSATPNRRIITVVVVNCAGLSGTETIDAAALPWVQLFLTEPMGAFNGNNDLYAEIIGPGPAQDVSVNRYVLRLVE